MGRSKEPGSSGGPSSPRSKRMRATSETAENDGSSKESSDYYYVLRSIQEELIDQQENSQNLSNQDETSSQTRSFERASDKSSDFAELLPGRLCRGTSKRATERASEKSTEKAFQRAPAIESSQSTAANESNRSDQTSGASSSEELQLTKSKTSETKRILTHLEQIQEEYRSIAKYIHPPSPCDKSNPFDRVRPTYLLKEALNSHSLNDITRLYTLNAKEKSICPYLLSKTGLLLFRKFIELRPEMEEELCNDLVDFVKHVRFSAAMPTAELFLDFLVFCYETGNQQLVEEFGDLNDHVTTYYHLPIRHMKQNFEMFQGLVAFIKFFKEFKEEKFDPERYELDEFKSKDLTHLCLQLKKLLTSSEYDQPLDHLLLCYADLLILFRKFEKAKRLLFKHYERHPTNPNAVIYILKFNELHLKDPEVFRKFYNRLLQLDPSHKCLIDYLDHLCLSVESLKILLSFVDYTANKDDPNAWKLIYTTLLTIERPSPEETGIREFYMATFASYWPAYHFTNVSIRISPENCDFLFHKAHVFNYFQPKLSEKFVSQVKLILAITKSDKLELLNRFEF